MMRNPITNPSFVWKTVIQEGEKKINIFNKLTINTIIKN